jgi:hypothetical protein
MVRGRLAFVARGVPAFRAGAFSGFYLRREEPSSVYTFLGRKKRDMRNNVPECHGPKRDKDATHALTFTTPPNARQRQADVKTIFNGSHASSV